MKDPMGGDDRVAVAYYREVGRLVQPTPESERKAFAEYAAVKLRVREEFRAKFPLEDEKAIESRVVNHRHVVPLKQKLANGYVKFVIGHAGKKSKNREMIQELISEGNIGLMVAIDKFDPTRNLRFLTYAAWWIDSYMREYLNKAGGVHVPSHARKKYRKQRQEEDKLIAQGKLKDYTVEEPSMASTDPAMLAAEFNTEDLVKNSEFNSLKHLYDAGLCRREMLILIYYYALRGGEARTFRDLSRVLYQFDGVKLTSERIRQLKEKGVKTLQRHLASQKIVSTFDVF